MTAKVLLADNHPIFRAGLRQVVDELEGYDCVGEAADGEACINQAMLLEPDFITADLNMPGRNGFEVAEWVAHNLPECRTVVVSMHADKAFVERALECGAHGFVAKEDAGSELALAFERSATGFFMSSSAGKPEPAFRVVHEDGDPAGRLGSLTTTERRVLALIAHSQTSREIAAQMGIAERTVHSHRNNICAKLGVHGANGLLVFAAANRDIIEALE